MELKLSLSHSDEILSEELRQAMEYRLTKVVNDKQNYLWNTNWLIVSDDNNCVIGGMMLKGLPNANGEVIIGYYTLPNYQGNGYMTETIIRTKSWLLSHLMFGI